MSPQIVQASISVAVMRVWPGSCAYALASGCGLGLA